MSPCHDRQRAGIARLLELLAANGAAAVAPPQQWGLALRPCRPACAAPAPTPRRRWRRATASGQPCVPAPAPAHRSRHQTDGLRRVLRQLAAGQASVKREARGTISNRQQSLLLLRLLLLLQEPHLQLVAALELQLGFSVQRVQRHHLQPASGGTHRRAVDRCRALCGGSHAGRASRHASAGRHACSCCKQQPWGRRWAPHLLLRVASSASGAQSTSTSSRHTGTSP